MHITGIKTYMQRVDDRPRLLLKIETNEGISGWGECYNHGPDWALPPLLDYLFHQIEGEDPRRVEFLILKLNQQCRFPPEPSVLPRFLQLIMHCGILLARLQVFPSICC